MRSRGRAVAALAALALTPGVAAGLSVASASASPLAAGPVLGGLTSQGLPMVVTLAPSGRRIARIDITMQMKCNSGDRFITTDFARDLAVGRSGRFVGTAVVGPHPPLLGAVDSLKGHYDRATQTITGTWRLRLVFDQSLQNDRCDSGPIAIHARL
jgi:hypothetical protein